MHLSKTAQIILLSLERVVFSNVAKRRIFVASLVNADPSLLNAIGSASVMIAISKGDVVTVRDVSYDLMVVLDFMDQHYAWVCPLGRCHAVELALVERLTFVRSGAATCKRLMSNVLREAAGPQCVLAQRSNNHRSEPKMVR